MLAVAEKPATDPEAGRKLKKQVLKEWDALKVERASWIPHWRECTELTAPRLGRFVVQQQNRGEELNDRIIDNTATRAVNVLRSMLMALGSSPARKWIRFGPSDPDLAKRQNVKEWWSYATNSVLRAYAASNTYDSLHQLYGEMVVIGTGADIVLPHYDRVLHHYPLTCGQYALANDAEGYVCTLFREYQMTAAQMVDEFGDACSRPVLDAYTKGDYHVGFTVIHAISPRRERDPTKLDAKNKRWRSIYVESGTEHRHNTVLRESGFDDFPALCPRWDLTIGDTYGRSPVMDALQDIRQLQDEQKCKGQNLQYAARPVMSVPTQWQNRASECVPGAWFPKEGDNKAEPLWTPDLGALQHQLASIADDRERINSTLFSDIILMLANDQRSGTTAREIEERHEEKIMMLGPIINRLTRELWEPLAIKTFERMLLAGAFPPLPEEMQGQDYGVETLSIFAQAQKQVGAQASERLITAVGALAQLNPDVRDKLEYDRIVDRLADEYGAEPDQITASEKAAVVRKARAEAQAAKEQAAMMGEVAKTAQALGNTPVGGPQPSALDAVTGYGRGVA
jgi:hypothetical protein